MSKPIQKYISLSCNFPGGYIQRLAAIYLTLTLAFGSSYADTPTHDYARAPGFNKSAVIFTQLPDVTTPGSDLYPASAVFWGHMPQYEFQSDAVIKKWVQQIESLRDVNLGVFGRSEWDWGWQWFLEFEENPEDHWVQNLNGDYVHYWYFGEQTHRGKRNNWLSHHSPRFKEFLLYQADRTLMAPVTHFLIDSQASSTRTVHLWGGDFSPYAMSGFREYLAGRYSDAELKQLGIGNIQNFDYQEFLISKGFTAKSYQKKAEKMSEEIPLFEDYVFFNRRALNELVDDLIDYVDKRRPGIAIGATTSIMEPRGYLFNKRLSFLAGELHQETTLKDSVPFVPSLHYKAAEAMKLNLIFFPMPYEYLTVLKRNNIGIVRSWVAQAYAMGAVHSVPLNVWVGGDIGTWNAPVEMHSDLFLFINRHKHLFDDYVSHARTALVLPVAASLDTYGLDGSKTAHESARYLIEHNIPFDLLIIGDKDEPFTSSIKQIDNYDQIFVDSSLEYLSDEQEDMLQKSAVKLVRIDPDSDTRPEVPSTISVSIQGKNSNEFISVLPRTSADPNAPYVLHLINRKFDPEENKMVCHSNIELKFSPSLFPNSISTAKLYTPGHQSKELNINHDAQGNLILKIPDIELWKLIELLPTPPVE